MNIDHIKNVSVIGAGAMGAQIAMVCSLAGFQVTLHDISEDNVTKAKDLLASRMDRRIKKGKLSEADVKEAFQRLSFKTDLTSAVEESDFVIEAIIEKLDIKREVFKKLDEMAPSHAILATNSSTIVSSKIASATSRPDKVCNMHFFNPALVMELVEVVQGPHTSDETAETTVELAKRIKKTPILLQKEISGFVANRILAKLMDEAIYLLENDIATAEEIDLACTKALNHPIGPFSLIDLTGLDVHYNVRIQRYQESGDPLDKPSKTVEEKVERGELGRKTGKGFYTYS